MRTPEQMYDEAINICRKVAMTEGDHDFVVTRDEYFKLHNVPYRSLVGTLMDRDRITGKPQRFCGLVLKIKEDEEEKERLKKQRSYYGIDESFEKIFK